MKTETKFRAWDNNAKQMISNDYVLPRFSDILYGKNYNLMQFIGLKDKNGNEIYQDDLVKYSGKTFIITWNQLHCSWALFDNGGMAESITADWIKDDGTIPDQWENTELEIIGNIHENKDLV